MNPELVVLLDPDGTAVGTALKTAVHHAHTPLHLAFSLYVFRPGGDLLLTQRAEAKATFPGVWTNSVCGHPGPGERLDAAAARRAHEELGLDVAGLRLVLPAFAYRAEMHGVVENEMCPVLVAWVDQDAPLTLDTDQVAQTSWVPWTDVVDGMDSGTRPLSPWSVEQVRALSALGPEPDAWPAGDPALLPAAARAGQVEPEGWLGA